MAVHSSLAFEPGDLMQVQFPISSPSTIRAVVRNRKDDCFGLEFLPQLPSGYNPADSGTPESPALASYLCNPETVLACLRRKQLQIKQVLREIEALKLASVLLADDEKKNPVSALPRRPEWETRPWPGGCATRTCVGNVAAED
jgi:hypothetical protein